MKKYKRIYIEITNQCNLNCSFCSTSSRGSKTMTVDEFEEIIKKIDKHTNYIYLHVKGEPLLHPDLEKILKISEKYNKMVNITTNATLLKKNLDILTNCKSIHQLNISMHSENNKLNYLEEIFSAVEVLRLSTTVIYRFWILKDRLLEKKFTEIVDKITNEYKLSTEIVDKINSETNIELSKNLYLNKSHEFIWPDIENDYYEECGYCHALKDHIAILSDGTVVPCCLDSEGIMRLGNIFKEELEEILSTTRHKNMISGFQKRRPNEELCKHCSFKDKFLINNTV